MRLNGPSQPTSWLVRVVGVGCALLAASSGVVIRAADRTPGSGVADLADRLKVGLRVEKPADREFCDAVARLVAEGRLPQQVVDGTYTWSLQRGKKYPFPAFEHVIRLKAARLGVKL